MFRRTYDYPEHRSVAALPDVTPCDVKPQLQGAKVLVADDERDARQMIRMTLENCGAQVQTAYNVDDAVSLAAHHHFDVIVSDLAMPGGDGFSLVRRLRLRGDKTPVIALSAMRGPDIERQVKEAGFVQHIDKPIEISFLASAVADAIIQARQARNPAKN